MGSKNRPSKRNSAIVIAIITGVFTLIGSALSVFGPDLKNQEAPADTPTISPGFGSISFTVKTLDGQLLGPADSFPSGVEEVYATFEYENMTAYTRFKRVWHGPAGGIEAEVFETWDYAEWGAAGKRTLPAFYNRDGWPAGTYKLQLLIDDVPEQTAAFTIASTE